MSTKFIKLLDKSHVLPQNQQTNEYETKTKMEKKEIGKRVQTHRHRLQIKLNANAFGQCVSLALTMIQSDTIYY